MAVKVDLVGTGDDQTDLASMWEEASLEYYNIIKVKPSEMKRFRSVDDILKDHDVQNSFKKFRDYGGPFAGERVAKLRHLIGVNTELILKGADFIKDAASAAFPPSASVITALTYVLTASRNIQKDYDDIEAFFEEMQEFFERLEIIEKTVPKFVGYRVQLMRVFSALMKLLGLATKSKSEGRMLRFGKTLLRGGGDDQLSEGRSNLAKALNRLQEATNFANLAVGYQNLDQGKQIKQDTSDIKEGQIIITEQVTGISEGVQMMMAKWDQFVLSQRRGKPSPSDDTGKSTSGSRVKPSALLNVRRALSTPDDPSIVDREIAYEFIEGTAKWLFDKQIFMNWRDNPSEQRILWLTGEPGTGKTFLAYATNQELSKSTAAEPDTFVAHHYCREGWDEPAMELSAFKSVVMQLASLDASFCTEVNAQMARAGAQWFADKNGLWFWRNLISKRFAKDSNRRLFFILDGVDEVHATIGAEKWFRRGLMLALKQLIAEGLQIWILISGRDTWEQHLGKAKLPYSSIIITKEDSVEDMKLFIDRHLKSASRLHKVRMPVKRKIRTTLLGKADCMLYLVHMLRRLNGMQHEKAILEELLNAPNSLHSLFSCIETEIHGRRTTQQIGALQSVYSWLAFGQRRLTTGEINGVAWVCGQYPAFSIEDEALTRSTNFLNIEGSLDEPDEEVSDDDQDSNQQGDQSILDTLKSSDSSNSLVSLINRTLQEYLRVSPPDSTAIRLSKNDAHFTIFQTCISLICDIDGQQKSPGGLALSEYAATWWGKHFRELDIELASGNMIAGVTRLLKEFLMNHNDAATFIETHKISDGSGVHYYTQSLGITKREKNDFMERLIPWLKKAALLPESLLDSETLNWVKDSVSAPLRIFSQLAHGHLTNWVQETPSERHSYGFAVDLLNMTDLGPKECFFGLGSEEAEFIGEVSGLFDLPQDSQACRAIGTTFEENNCLGDAVNFYHHGLEIAKNEIEKLKSSLKLAGVLVKCAALNVEPPDCDIKEGSEESTPAQTLSVEKCFIRSYDLLREALALQLPLKQSKTLPHVRECLLYLAFCELNLGKYDDAVISFEKARMLQPEEILEGNALSLLPTILAVKQERYGEFIEKIKSWNLLERMAWLITDSNQLGVEELPHITLMRAGHLAKEDNFVIRVYEEIIAFLDLRKTAGTMRYMLADFYFHVVQNLASAKDLLRNVATSVSLDPTWNRPDTEGPSFARSMLGEVLYAEFRSTADPVAKVKLMEEMKEVQQQRLSNSRFSEITEYTTATTYAAMLRKMGNMVDFQHTLEDVFQFCIASLTDTEGWNDSLSLRLLAKVLALVGGLELEAQIAFSAQYSVLDPDIAHAGNAWYPVDFGDSDIGEPSDSESEGNEERGKSADEETRADEKPPEPGMPTNENGTDENEEDEAENTSDDEKDDKIKKDPVWGDIDTTFLACGGEHSEFEDRFGFEKGPLYLCIICANTHLCQDCFNKIRQLNQNTTSWNYWRHYCGVDHKYIKAPVDGWKGVRDGIMMIGATEQKFSEWLNDLKRKWKEAWEAFWIRQDGIVDILGSGPIVRRGAVHRTSLPKASRLLTRELSQPDRAFSFNEPAP